MTTINKELLDINLYDELNQIADHIDAMLEEYRGQLGFKITRDDAILLRDYLRDRAETKEAATRAQAADTVTIPREEFEKIDDVVLLGLVYCVAAKADSPEVKFSKSRIESDLKIFESVNTILSQYRETK